jgi:YbbR domain-containing protein
MRKWVLHNLGLKILSLGLAAFLWIVVLGEQKVEVAVNVPFGFDVPANLILVNDPPDVLEIHLRGPRTLVTSLTPREVALQPLSVTLEEGETFIPIRPELVRAPRGIQVVDVSPRRVRVVLEALVEREVEVSPRAEGNLPDGFLLRRLSAVPPRVRMTGPRTELSRLSRVRTVPVSLDGQTSSFMARVLLEPMGPKLRVLEGTTITVEVEIVPRKS